MADQVSFVVGGVVIIGICLIVFGAIAWGCKRLIRRSSSDAREKRARKRREQRKPTKEAKEDQDESEDDVDDPQGANSPNGVHTTSVKRKQDDESDDDLFPAMQQLDENIKRFDQDPFALAELGLLLPRSGLPKHKIETLSRPFVRPTKHIYPVRFDLRPELDMPSPREILVPLVVEQIRDSSTSRIRDPFRALSLIDRPQSRWLAVENSL